MSYILKQKVNLGLEGVGLLRQRWKDSDNMFHLWGCQRRLSRHIEPWCATSRLISNSSLDYNKAVSVWEEQRDAAAFTSQVGLQRMWSPRGKTQDINCGGVGFVGGSVGSITAVNISVVFCEKVFYLYCSVRFHSLLLYTVYNASNGLCIGWVLSYQTVLFYSNIWN